MTKKKPRKPKGKKETSSRVSAIAGRILAVLGAVPAAEIYSFVGGGKRFTMKEVKVLAASCLSQDETPRVGRKRGRK